MKILALIRMVKREEESKSNQKCQTLIYRANLARLTFWIWLINMEVHTISDQTNLTLNTVDFNISTIDRMLDQKKLKSKRMPVF